MTIFCTVASLKVPALIVYDVATKILNIEFFPQHNIADLNSGITFIVLFSQEKPLGSKEINTHKEHLQMAISLWKHVHESKGIMYGWHQLILSTSMMAIRNEMHIGGKRLCSISSEFCFNMGKESNPIWIIQWNLSTFPWDVRLCFLITLVVTCKERHNLCMNCASRWIVNHWIVYPGIAQTLSKSGSTGNIES